MGEHDHRMRKRGKIVLIGFLLVAMDCLRRLVRLHS
ncbi:NADPH-dependent glutamate synthase beta subunit-like oxidoreductase [Sphingomonas trueperi]|uniref:NADPH-dependent glutamate synthase beta subunit-like oxidoreductase n=1 Tax=Sphingomonas trueperi TaxID=53317 RepID=A0A7X5Y1J9_9SPHN|nr:NADPH-dependent glutamate synthase beta subunit-like oxidoreductase [Sphingomonas trueperi]